jgi:group I intron endonuclease
MAYREEGFGVYLIRNTVNGKAYVGSTQRRFRERWCAHRAMLRGNKHPCRHLQSAWNKYGEAAFRFEVAEALGDTKMAVEREQYWLDVFQTLSKAYNSRPRAASNSGAHWTKEVRQQISQTLKDYYADPINYARYRASRMEPELRATLSMHCKARWANPDFKTGVSDKIAAAQGTWPGFVAPDGTEYRDVVNLTRFCKEHGLAYSSMWLLGTRDIVSHRGWRHIDWQGDRRKSRTPKPESYSYLGPDGKEYRGITNMAAFCREHGLRAQSMYCVRTGRTKQHKGWRHLPLE